MIEGVEFDPFMIRAVKGVRRLFEKKSRSQQKYKNSC